MHFDPAPEAHNAGLLARNSEECTLQSWRKCARTAVSLCEAARYFIRIWLLSTCIIDYRQPQPQFLGIRKTGVYGLILVFQEIRAMVWRPNMLPCNSSAWQHWKQHNAQRKRSDAWRSCSRARCCTGGSFIDKLGDFITHSCLVVSNIHLFPSQKQDPTRMMILNGFGMLWGGQLKPPTSHLTVSTRRPTLWTSARQRAWLLQLVDHKPESISKHVFRRHVQQLSVSFHRCHIYVFNICHRCDL